MIEIEDHDSYREAIETNDHGKWITTMERKIEFLDRSQIWILVDLPKDSKTIGYRWVFRKKNNEQYKIRLVAKGYAQKEGIDYNKIFSLVVKHTSTRVLLAILAQFDLE